MEVNGVQFEEQGAEFHPVAAKGNGGLHGFIIKLKLARDTAGATRVLFIITIFAAIFAAGLFVIAMPKTAVPSAADKQLPFLGSGLIK